MKPGFQTRFALTLTVDFRNFAMMEQVPYLAADGTLYIIAKGARSDLASIPRMLWSLLPPAGEDGAEYGLCAYLHDVLYRRKIKVQESGGTLRDCPEMTKDRADLLLKESMELCGVPAHIVTMIYEGVRLGGQAAWDSDRI